MLRRLCLLLLLVTAVHAETFVVCAGVEKYDDSRISSLKHAVADAKSVAAAFRASGVARNQVTLLTSDATQPNRRPTRIALVTALQQVKQKARHGDKLIFFFAGHGIEEDGNQYLLTVDTRRDLIDATALPMDLVNRALKGLQASDVLFIVDACRNAPDAGRGDEGAQLTEGLIRGVRPRIVPANEDAKPELLATLLSCDVGQRAYEDPDAGHGVFTTYLLKGLAGEAATTNGPVELRQLAEYVTREVGDWAKRSNKEQTPRLVTEGDGDMVLLTPPPEPLVSVSFQRQPLSAVVELIAEQYGAQVVLGKGVDPTKTVSGHLENQPLSRVLKVLLLAVDLQVRRDRKIYIIEAPDAEPVQPVQPQPVQPPAAFEKPEGFNGPVITVAQDGSGQYQTIQAAADAAPEGAIIKIKPGTYREAVTVSKRLCLRGEGGPAKVVIEAEGRTALAAAATGCEARGLTVRASGSSPYLRGVEAASGFVAVQCDFVLQGGDSNSAAFGVPMDTGNGRTVLRDCTLTSPSWAATIASGEASIDTCRFEGAVCGLLVGRGSSASVRDCHFAGYSDSGVKAWGDGTSVNVVGCHLDGQGTAAFASLGATISVENCSIRGSTARALRANDRAVLNARNCRLGSAQGVAASVSPDAQITITDCRFAFPADLFLREPGGTLVEHDNIRVPLDLLEQDITPDPLAAFPGPTIIVAQDGSGQYTSIQAAADAAPEGAILKIKPGEYIGAVKVEKRLALVGDGPRDEVILAADEETILKLATSADRSAVQGVLVELRGRGSQSAQSTMALTAMCSVSIVDCRFRFVGTAGMASAIAIRSGSYVARCITEGFTSYSLVSGGRVEVADCRLHRGIYCQKEGVVSVRRTALMGERGTYGYSVFHAAFGGCISAADCAVTGVSEGPEAHVQESGEVHLTRCRFSATRDQVIKPGHDGTIEATDCQFGLDPASLTIPGLPE